MLKRFFMLIVTSAFISSILLLAGTAILDRVNAAQTSAQVQALLVSQAKLSEGNLSVNQISDKPVLIESVLPTPEPKSTTVEAIQSDPTAFTGEFITLTGTTTQTQPGKVVLNDGTGSIELSLGQNLVVTDGGKVTVTGFLELGKSGEQEMDVCRMVDDQGMVIQLDSCNGTNDDPASNDDNSSDSNSGGNDQPLVEPTDTTIAELTNNPVAYLDTIVSLSGMVTILSDDKFMLNDGTGQILVDLEDNQVAMLGLVDGQMITVTGRFDDDGSSFEIDACKVGSEAGDTITDECSGQDDDQLADNHDPAKTDDSHDDMDDSDDDTEDHQGSSSDDGDHDDDHSGSSSDDGDHEDDRSGSSSDDDDHEDDRSGSSSDDDDHEDDDNGGSSNDEDDHDDDHKGDNSGDDGDHDDDSGKDGDD